MVLDIALLNGVQ